VHHDRVRLNEIIERSLDMFGGLAEFRDIQLTSSLSEEAEVLGNRQHLRQLIYNLMDNALKFTAAEGRVHVSLTATAGQAELVVADTGPGIPAEELPHIFDRFFRGDRTRTCGMETRGNGLGLSICESVVRAHEGTITAESNPGQGSRFIVRLPLADRRASQ
jgi:signal transduction histidine kinase